MRRLERWPAAYALAALANKPMAVDVDSNGRLVDLYFITPILNLASQMKHSNLIKSYLHGPKVVLVKKASSIFRK